MAVVKLFQQYTIYKGGRGGGGIWLTIPGYNTPRDVKTASEIPHKKARATCFLAEKEGGRKSGRQDN